MLLHGLIFSGRLSYYRKLNVVSTIQEFIDNLLFGFIPTECGEELRELGERFYLVQPEEPHVFQLVVGILKQSCFGSFDQDENSLLGFKKCH